MPQHVTCNVREHDVSIIKSRLKLRDCIFPPLDFALVSFPFLPLVSIVDRIARVLVVFMKTSVESSNYVIYFDYYSWSY